MKCIECGNNVSKDEYCTNCGKLATATKNSKVGDLKLPQEVKGKLQSIGEKSKDASEPKTSNSRTLLIGLIASIAFTVILFLVAISVMTGMESRLADLEDEVFFLEDRVSSLETDITNLESEISDTRDWTTGEIDSVQSCVNDFIDVWAQRQSYALYCR